MNPNSPQMSIVLPSPQPVISRPRPKPPAQPQQAAPAPQQPAPRPAPRTPQRSQPQSQGQQQEQWSSLILPYTPPTRRMARPRRYSQPTTLASLLKEARENPDEPTIHGAIADAMEESYPDSPIPELIRRQYGLGQHAESGSKADDTIWHSTFYGLYPNTPNRIRTVSLGTDGPFEIHLGHSPNMGTSPSWERNHPRWVVHAVSTLPGTENRGYSFEFPHSQAHLIPQMFPKAASHIHPGTHGIVQRGKKWVQGMPHDENYRNQEANNFNDLMDRQEQNR